MGIILSIPEGISQAWTAIERAFTDLAPFLTGLFHGQGRQEENQTDRSKIEPLNRESKNVHISPVLTDAVLHCSISSEVRQPVVVIDADDETTDGGENITMQINPAAAHCSTSGNIDQQRLQVDEDTVTVARKQSLLPQRANYDDNLSSSASTVSEQVEDSPLNPRASRSLLIHASSSQQQEHQPTCC